MGARFSRRLLASLALAGLGASAAAAAANPPATLTQVQQAVAASTSIHSIPGNLAPSLQSVSNDPAWKGFTGKSWGPSTSTKRLVIFGDSHAHMWVPAIVPGALARGYNVHLYWDAGCLPAHVTIYGYVGHPNSYFTSCNTWRAARIAAIVAARPTMIVLAERTTAVKTSPTAYLTDAQLQAGLAATLRALKPSGAKIVVVGDNPAYTNFYGPDACVTINPSNVQRCSFAVTTTSTAWRDHQGAELAATTAEGARFINPVPWICTSTTCSPIVSHYLVYLDWSHLTATYAAWLSTVMATSLFATN
jgi:hypothetical protein